MNPDNVRVNGTYSPLRNLPYLTLTYLLTIVHALTYQLPLPSTSTRRLLRP